MTSMRILMIHNRYGASARGGAERVVERLMAALIERGHAVSVHHRTTVGFDALGPIPAIVRAFWYFFDLLNLVAAFRLRMELHRTNPDIIHTHNLIGCGGLTPRIIRRSGIPWVHTLHDVQLITPSGLFVYPIFYGRTKLGTAKDSGPNSTLERSMIGRAFRALRRRLFGNPNVVHVDIALAPHAPSKRAVLPEQPRCGDREPRTYGSCRYVRR